MTRLALTTLHPDPRNSNVCSADVLEKLRRNIEKSQLYPPLIVRPHPTESGQFILIDGHHRKQVLASLGHPDADCLIWEISERDAQIALATLNTLRGTENLHKRAELLQNLTALISIDELTALIPETSAEMTDLLALLQHDTAELEQAMRTQIATEKAALPVPFTFLVAADQASLVEKTLAQFQPDKPDRGVALVELCAFALKQMEQAHVQSG